MSQTLVLGQWSPSTAQAWLAPCGTCTREPWVLMLPTYSTLHRCVGFISMACIFITESMAAHVLISQFLCHSDKNAVLVQIVRMSTFTHRKVITCVYIYCGHTHSLCIWSDKCVAFGQSPIRRSYSDQAFGRSPPVTPTRTKEALHSPSSWVSLYSTKTCFPCDTCQPDF